MCYVLGLWRSLPRVKLCEIFFGTTAIFDILIYVRHYRKLIHISFFVCVRKSYRVKWFHTIFRRAKPNKELQFILKWWLFTLYPTHTMLYAFLEMQTLSLFLGCTSFIYCCTDQSFDTYLTKNVFKPALCFIMLLLITNTMVCNICWNIMHYTTSFYALKSPTE